MTSLMELLESFNRKERFFLIGDALGNRAFQLSTDFRARISAAFGIQPRANRPPCFGTKSEQKVVHYETAKYPY